MSERTLKQLVGALVLVVSMWAIATLLSGGGGGMPSAAGEIAAVFDGVSETTATEVRMTNESGELVLAGGAGAWTVNDLRTDSGTVYPIRQLSLNVTQHPEERRQLGGQRRFRRDPQLGT